MHDAIHSMLARYNCTTRDDYINALREILQEVALLGLWRSKFFEHAACYGGTALRVLYGLDRYSEDLDFSLLKPEPGFSLKLYGKALLREVGSFGFKVEFESRERTTKREIESAFLKATAYRQLILIEAPADLIQGLHPGKMLKIKLEVDVEPPGGFETESRYLMQPIPFAIRAYTLPDLLAGKLHAVLCRKWKARVKGRDWYDLVWYAGRHPQVRLRHMEARMRQSGDYDKPRPMSHEDLMDLLRSAIDRLDVRKARDEVAPFVRDRRALEVWSADFFHQIIERLEAV